VKAVLGLGNPGNKYTNTRHNIGFMIMDYLARFFLKSFVSKSSHYKLLSVFVEGEEILLVKPMTFMNLSGDAALAVCDDFGLNADELLLVYDDFHLPFGTLRFRLKGSDGGHNGVKSVISALQTENIERLRFGIGNKNIADEDVVGFVLGAFSAEEEPWLPRLIKISAEAVLSRVRYKPEKIMNDYNRNFIIQEDLITS
jgi:PTH1 family peptidyl-tRNA hydrolase